VNGEFYRRAFWVLVAFLMGNGVSFFVFGIHTVSTEDFNRGNQSVTGRLDAQDSHLQAIDTRLANLSGQLTAKKLLAPQQ
jgi:hypothetical protein